MTGAREPVDLPPVGPDPRGRRATEEELLDLLRSNVGFDKPEDWISYARFHNLARVQATRLAACPDCGAPHRSIVGQYVYYSNLIRLCRCPACDLIYSDVHLDPSVVAAHFERAYKDETYFQAQRRPIFRHVASLVSRLSPAGGRILDVGGAKGHLLRVIREKRPDLKLTLNDISTEACAHAESELGVEAVCSTLASLGDLGRSWDVVLLIDVLYYEPDIRRAWDVLSDVTAPGGIIIARIPNHLWLTRLAQVSGLSGGWGRQTRLQDRIPFFNPEHIYVFSRRYLTSRLERAGFKSPRRHASPLLGSDVDVVKRLWSFAGGVVSLCSLQRVVATPAMVFVAERAERRA